MKKMILLAFICSSFLAGSVFAGVTFLPAEGSSVGTAGSSTGNDASQGNDAAQEDEQVTNGKKCEAAGYTIRTYKMSECNHIPPGTSPGLETCPYKDGYYKCVYKPLRGSYYCAQQGYHDSCAKCGGKKHVCPYDESYCYCEPIVLEPLPEIPID